MKNESKSKVSINIYSPLSEFLNNKLTKACIKRDAYLDLVIKNECNFLRNEIKTPNTNKIKKHISKKIKGLNTKPVSLFLSTETAQLLNKVCDEKNVPRDAFLNRIYLLLSVSTDVIKILFPVFQELQDNDGDLWTFFVGAGEYCQEQETSFCFRPNVIDTVDEFISNSPFWLLRACITDINSSDEVDSVQYLYSHAFEPGLMRMWPKSYPFTIKDSDIVCFNTFMDETQLVYATDNFNLEKIDKFIDKNNQEARRALTIQKAVRDAI